MKGKRTKRKINISILEPKKEAQKGFLVASSTRSCVLTSLSMWVHPSVQPCSLHVLHRRDVYNLDIYNFIYPHSASCAEFLLLSSSALPACLAAAPAGITHPLLYKEPQNPDSSQPHPTGGTFWGCILCYTSTGTGT